MTDLNKVVKVALMALTMMVGVQSAGADDVTPAELMEKTKTPFGFATLSSRTANTAYNITGGGAYTVSDIKALVKKGKDAGGNVNESMTVDGKKVIVLTSDGDKSINMASTILSAIQANDIIVFDGDHSLMGTKTDGKTNFYVDAYITLSGLSGKTLIGVNGARLCTTWYLTDIIKSWLNSVETSSGSGVSNASTDEGTGDYLPIYDENGNKTGERYIKEEGEYLTRKTLVEKGLASKKKQLDYVAGVEGATEPTAQDLENIKFLLTEEYRKSGVFYITGCQNLIIRNLSFQGPGSVDVGGYDLLAVIYGTKNVWVDHCEFIDGQDGNFDITNESDFITTSWCHFHYTDRSYVHQNTNLIGSNDKYDGQSGESIDDTGKLNITFAYNEWGENCRSRMPMARFGKIHMLNNWYNCPGNTENAINPRKQSEFLIEGNYFASGVTKTFKVNGSTGVSVSDNTVVDPAASSVTASGTAVSVPYTYNKVASTKVPDMLELLIGPILDKEPTYTVNPDNHTTAGESTVGYYLNTTASAAAQGLTFSVWADYAMTYQWYKTTKADLSGATKIEGETRNSITFKTSDEGEIYLYCVATGLAGTAQSNPIKITIAGQGQPIFSKNLKSVEEAIKGVAKTLSVDAGNNATYQWYKNSSAASTDGAVAIDGATGKTLTITVDDDLLALNTEFYYCVATRIGEEGMTTTSNIVRVKYVSTEWLINFVATTKDAGTDGGGNLTGLELQSADGAADSDKTVTNKKKCNADATNLSIIQIAKSLASSNKYTHYGVKLSHEGGFKKGDVVTIGGYYNNSSTKTTKVALYYVDAEDNATLIGETDNVINGKTTAGDPTEKIIVLDKDYDSGTLYVGRDGSTTTCVSKIVVTRGDPVQPYITTDLEASYEAKVTIPIAMTVTAEDAQSYAWYTCDDTNRTNPKLIEGKTSSTLEYSVSTAGTTYVYCVVTNGTGEKAKTTMSRVATVVATGTAKLKKTYTWDMKDWQEMAKDNGAGVSQDFGATEDSSQRMYYYADLNSVGSDARNIEGFSATKFIRTPGGADLATGAFKRVLKYHAPDPGKITVYVRGANKNDDGKRILYINNSPSTTNAVYAPTGDGTNQVDVALTYEFDDETDIYIWHEGGGVYYYGIVADIYFDPNQCETPGYAKGAWSGDANQKWSYTVTSGTSTAKLVYTINGVEQPDTESNSTVLQLSPGDIVRAQAKDKSSTNTKTDSKWLEFKADVMPTLKEPEFTVGGFNISGKNFPVTIKTDVAGATIYYTTDGSAPSTSSLSCTSGATVDIPIDATLNAYAHKDYYTDSSVGTVESTKFAFSTSGWEYISKNNGSTTDKDNSGLSYTISGTYNAGKANDLSDGLKLRVNGKEITGTETNGFRISANTGFAITKIEAEAATTNSEGEGKTSTISGVYVDVTDGNYNGATSKITNSIVIPPRKTTPGTFTIDNLYAQKWVDFVVTGVNQANILFKVYYEVIDSPASFVVNGESDNAIAIRSFDGNHEYTIPSATATYEENPTIVMTTDKGFTHTLVYEGTEESGEKLSKFSFTILGVKYTVKAKVTGFTSPLISIAEDFEIAKHDGVNVFAPSNGGYKVTLSAINSDPSATPYLILDGGAPVVYNEKKSYYALKTVSTYLTYKDGESTEQTVANNEDCPENTYDKTKPFAIFMYQYGYSDGGAGQEGGATASTWDKTKDKIYLGLTDKYNVIDLVLQDEDQKKMITAVRPDIRNAKLVVVSEMIGSKSPEAGSVYAESKLQDAIMSVRDSVIGYTNVLNVKMYFYSQSQNYTTRWAWAQPATLPNDKLSIMPTDARYKVFENVSFSRDGSIALWSGIDEESTLNRLQLVHNFNEDNENLPSFTQLATATDDEGEVYDALHWFKKDGYQYIATGISINDYEHYDENLHNLVATIGDMINNGVDLDTKLDNFPAPRIKDNGDGAATITNNSPTSPTYYRTSASGSETWSANDIKTGEGAKTVDENYQTVKFESDTWVYAVTDVNGTLTAVSKALVKGNTTRYIYRTNTTEGVTGVEATYAFSTTDAAAGTVKIPYNQSFYKEGYTVTKWRVKGRTPEQLYIPGEDFPTKIDAQDLTLEAVWEENTHLITDADVTETEEMRTVTWNLRQSGGAPALSLEAGSTKLGKTGIIVGQMHFLDGKFIDVPMTIDASGSATLQLSTGGVEQSGKFNNTSTNYVDHDFAQVRTGTKFSFPAVYGMTVKYVPTQFKKQTGENEYEVDETYVTMSTLSDGTLTLTPSNPGLTTADGKITIAGGIATVATDNRTTGGTYSYTGEATTATLTTIDAAMLTQPEAAVGTLNNTASVFMDKLVVVYPQLHNLTTEITLPEDNDSISAEPQVRVDLTPVAKANCNGRYLADTELQITVTPSYGYFIANTAAVTFNPDAANNSKRGFTLDGKTGVLTGYFTMKAGTAENPGTKANVAVSQKLLRAYEVYATPLSAGSVRINSNTGKSEEEEYLKFVEGTTITISPTPKVGYQFDEWVNDKGESLNVTGSGDNAIAGVTKKIETGETEAQWRGDLQVVVGADNSTVKYYAKFKTGNEGTVTYNLPLAALYVSDTQYDQFGAKLFDVENLSDITITDIPTAKQARYQYSQQYTKYKFPVARTTTALYIPTNYTLYKVKDNESPYGYTLRNWVYIPNFDEDNPQAHYDNREEYQIGKYYYFNEENETRMIMPIFKKNDVNFDYRITTADITWDFRTAYRAQRLYFDEVTEFDYATHTTINGNEVIDVPLHIKGKVDNTVLDEWCHFDDGTEITIPSGLGAKFTLATYNKLTSTTIDGVVPTDYTMKEENKVPVYYYTYVTPSTATGVKLVIGKDHTYYKSIRAQLPSADKVTITTTVNNSVQGSSELLGAWSDSGKTQALTPAERTLNETDTEYTLALGSYVTVKATRQRYYELKYFLVDGEKITAENAAEKGYTLTEPEGRGTEYSLTFRLFSYATTVEAVFDDRETYQITYGTGGQAYGEAPGVQVVERGETFTMPTKNQTLYMEGYTLKYWMDEDGENAKDENGNDTGANRYEWGKEYLTSKHLYLIPVFEINDFTLFDIPSGYRKVSWPLITGADNTYGNGPLLKYQKSSGVTVSQLYLTDEADSPFIDMPLNINCTDAGKVDNSAVDYRCQINSGSLFTLQTNANCKIKVYTSNGEMRTTKIAGSTSYSNTKYTGSIGASTNDNYVQVSYTGSEATQDIQFTGDANYFKMVEVEYGAVSSEGLPKLEQVTINNIALGSFGSTYENYALSTLVSNKTITIPVTLSTDARTMPRVKANADQDDAIISITQATIDNRTATIILKDKNKATVGIYKIDFDVTYTAVAAPELQKVEMSGKLVMALDLNNHMQNYLEDGATMNVNGAISVTFNEEMVADSLPANKTGQLNQTMECTATNGGKTLVFSYWGLDVDKSYTFTIPAGTLRNAYEKTYNSAITFTFRTAATSQVVHHKNVNFVVTHSQSHTFNSADPTKNYTSTSKKQVASNELIANLEAAGIAYGTIDEGLALANSNTGTERYYIFVPNGEYQIKGDTQTDAIQSAGNGYAPADNSGTVRKELMGKQIYNGVTVISHDNISITGQDQEKTKLWNKPEVEGISYTSTFFVKNTSGFYVQDMTLQNAFDYKTSIAKQGAASAQAARAVVLRDRGYKTIMKNVTMDSWQDTYYSNLSNRYNDSRGYFEDCTIKGYVDFFCGDGDQWFERCNLMLRNRGNGNAVNMVAPSTYDNQLWGYVFNNCKITAEDDASYKVNNGKFTLARPWKNSPAASFLGTTFNVLSTDDGYKQMTSGGLVLRFHEYGSKDSNGTLLDLSLRSLRASSPGPGSYAAVMTPDEAKQYTVHNALGGDDGYDPTLYTKQISMKGQGLTSVDRSLSWNAQSEALCYFIFRKNADGEGELYAITKDNTYDLDDDQIGRTFFVRAANQRGGLGEASEDFVYEVHESFKLTLTDRQQAEFKGEMWDWSTIYLDYNAKAPTVADDNENADVYVYAVVDVQGTLMTLKRVKVLEKDQGYIVKGKAGTYTFAYTDSQGDYWDGVAPSGIARDNDRLSILDGVTEDTERDGMYVYTMYYKANYGLGFYNFTGEFLSAHKAYLDGQYVKDEGVAGGIVIDGDNTNSTGFLILDDYVITDIGNVNGNDSDNSERIYTVYGQRVKRSEMIKGRVYIVNGRKLAY